MVVEANEITQPTKAKLHREFIFASLVCVMLSYSWMYSNITVPNERSRVYLAVSMVDGQTIKIDKALKRFGRIDDRATFKGHYYSDKAPGSAFLAAAIYRIAGIDRASGLDNRSAGQPDAVMDNDSVWFNWLPSTPATPQSLFHLRNMG